MPLTFATAAVLLVLFIQYNEGFQRVLVIRESHPYDDSFSDDIDDATSDDSGSGTLNGYCCMHGNCSCSSLYNALVNLTNNVLINITTNATLHSVIPMVGLVNITITGHNNPTVYCTDYGGLHLMSCKNCIIEGITWKGCGGGKNINDNHPVLKFHNSSNTAVRNCTFQNSIGQALELSGVSGNMNIDHCNFLHNKLYRSHGTAIHSLSNTLYLNLTIANCKFSYNGDAESVIYFGPPSTKYWYLQSNFHLHNSSFHFNRGVPIYLCSQKLDIYGNIEFYHNIAKHGGGIYITDYSAVIFHKSVTVNFTHNTATNTGGAIYLINHSSILFKEYSQSSYKNYPSNQEKSKQTFIFYQNRANKFGKDIYATSHSNVLFGNNAAVTFNGDGEHKHISALHIEHISTVTFEGNSKATFKNDKFSNAGAIYIHGESEIIFKGNTTVILNTNAGIFYGEAALFVHSSIAIFQENCKVIFNDNIGKNSHINNSSDKSDRNSMGKLLYNTAFMYRGRAIYITKYSIVRFDGNSEVSVNNNTALNGGALHLTSRSAIIFDGNSIVTFNNNDALNNNYSGGALYVADHSTLTFKGNCTVTLNNNNAYNGGAMYNTYYSTITFEGNSTVKFNKNNATNNGGAIYVNDFSTLKFAGNSEVRFNNNSAGNGGAVYSFISCVETKELKFTGSSRIVFDNNESQDKGGAVCIEGSDPNISNEKCYLIIVDNSSTVIFINNKAFNGGAVYIGYNVILISQENSVLTFYDNEAHIGGAIYSYANNMITFQGNSSATFNNNVALHDGGVLFSYRQCYILITENSKMTFAYNEAAQGGVIHIRFSSVIKFEGNSKILFTENKAIEYGGVMYSSINCLIAINDNVDILFHSNTAKNGGAMNLYRAFITSRSKSNMTFKNNIAEMGGAIYAALSNITFAGNSSLQFIRNTALQDGGAIYLSEHSDFVFADNSNANFSDNFATDDGDSIYMQLKESLLSFNNNVIHFSDNNLGAISKPVYINVPKSYNKTCLLQRVMKIHKNISLPIITSPRKLILYYPAKCIDVSNTDCNSYYISNIMLGQEIRFNACVLDYYDQPTELTQFLVTGMNHQYYNISGSKYISVSCNHTTQAINIIGNFNTLFNYSINISMYAAKTSGSKIISVNLIVELSQCHPGFYYSSESRKCECYNSKGIISCSGSNSTIKRGYWFGSVNSKSTVTSCPNNYCNFTCCEITNGVYHLYPVRTNQCRSHRSGNACGNCEKGFTLSFDSPECIELHKCTIGQTALVISLSLLYWITVIVTVFIMMHFKVTIGSLYGIIYYYSVVDILLRQVLYISNGLYTTINILSSLAKLTPQFLGQLCLVRNMSGIDQQFIHYIHPMVVSFILVIIITLARKSPRISSFISRGIIHFICFLLLLSYTSVTTTSLLLMRSLMFTDINRLYTYLSPDIEYFHGHHLGYVIMAIIFTITVVIGLPLLLLLEPFLNSKINFIKIKPLLDQFQGSYKDKYRYFAAYYMICRIVIIVLVIARSSDDLSTHYALITACTLMALIHLIVRPYVDNICNIFDGIILHLIVVISVLPIIEFAEDYNKRLIIVVTFVFVIIPLASFIAVKLWVNKNEIQSFIKLFTTKCINRYNTLPTDDVEIPPINEVDISVDNSRRRNVTVVDM